MKGAHLNNLHQTMGWLVARGDVSFYTCKMLLKVSGKLTIIYCVLSIGISEQHVYEVLNVVLQFTKLKICCYAVSYPLLQSNG